MAPRLCFSMWSITNRCVKCSPRCLTSKWPCRGFGPGEVRAFLYLVGHHWAVRMDLHPRAAGRLRGGLCHVCEFQYAYFQFVDFCNSGSLRCTPIEDA